MTPPATTSAEPRNQRKRVIPGLLFSTFRPAKALGSRGNGFASETGSTPKLLPVMCMLPPIRPSPTIPANRIMGPLVGKSNLSIRLSLRPNECDNKCHSAHSAGVGDP